ncbi:MAG: recombinase family protein [Pigmentiphaga sp.]
MPAAIYLRSSKDRSDVSIDAQRRALQEMGAARGIPIVAEFADAVESGKDDDRPGFQTMLRALRDPRRGWDTILVLDTARIARRRHLSIIFEEHECKKAGVRVLYKSLPESDPITEMLLKSILQAMDEWHSLTSRAKGLAGMSENVRQGFRAGGIAPKGYRLEHIATGATREGQAVTKSKLIPGDDAMLVRAYLQHRAKGVTRARALAHIGQDWPATTLLSIERNALTYAGHTCWNRHAERAEHGGYVGGNKYRPRAEWVIQRDTHEPFITEDEAEAILAAVESRKLTKVRTTTGYMLTGLLVAPNGERWWAAGAGNYRIGKGKRIRAAEVDKAVIGVIARDIAGDDFAKAVLAHYAEQAKPATKYATRAKLASRVAEIDRQASKLAGLLGETSAPQAILRQIEKLEAERENVAAQLDAAAEDEKTRTTLRSLTLADVKRFLSGIAAQIEAEPDLLKEAISGIVDKVVLDPTSMEAVVTYKIADLRGVKVASPRVSEFNTSFEHRSAVVIHHRRRA